MAVAIALMTVNYCSSFIKRFVVKLIEYFLWKPVRFTNRDEYQLLRV